MIKHKETGVGRTGEGHAGATRRRVLAAGAVAAVAGCSSPARESNPLPAGIQEIRAEEARRQLLAAHSTVLRERYDAVIARHPQLAGRLGALRAAVAEHEQALLPGDVRPTASPSGTAPASGVTASKAASASPSGAAAPVSGSGVPADPDTALKDLAAAERRTSDSFAEALVEAEPELARLLASIAAAGAAHAYLLTQAPAEGAR
ncbi:hypothetical protein [Streptomyces sp. MUM 178J]|uniref:hypothetical protein n=1 Tax=Streptomyces sp. MUM 178J TaxID=2791991 RepID=UPI001F03BFA3|nr:hypothetical protein [Streptomyces sp. MUM 178J]WRQ83410.1 hypothetical protein I3F59_017135 [Streptomyces sp. MUM 178J]